MRIKSILNEANQSNAAMLLEGQWNDLTFTQKNQINLIERELKPLFDQLSYELVLNERELTPEEIESIFDKAVETAEQGKNRTLIGKVKDVSVLPLKVMQELDKKINELGKTIQNSEPVKNFDDKFDKLKTDITEQNGDKKVVQMLQFLSDKAKEHPTATVMIIGVTTAAAPILAGPVGGAAAGFIMNSISKLLQGEKLSTALGTSAKTAIYGALAGMSFRWISNEIIENIAFGNEQQLKAMEEAAKAANVDAVKAEALAKNPALAQFLNVENLQTVEMSGYINNFTYDYNVFLSPENADKYVALRDAMTSTKTFSEEYYKAATEFHNFMSGVQQSPGQATYRAAASVMQEMADAGKTLSAEQLDSLADVATSMSDRLQALATRNNFIGGVVQAAIQQTEDFKKSMHKVEKAERPPEETNESLAEISDMMLNENVFSDAVIKAYNKAKQTGQNITRIVTKDKLMKAWKKAGSPTESTEIEKILKVYFTTVAVKQMIGGEEVTQEPESDETPQFNPLDKLVASIQDSESPKELIDYIKSKIA